MKSDYPYHRHAAALLVTAACLCLGHTGVRAAVTLPLQLEKDGDVSLAVYDARGRMTRELLRAEPRKAGDQTVTWDGLDAHGKPAAPGVYTWKALQTEGLTSEYLFSLGTSFNEKHWPGQHAGPSAVALDGDTLYVCAGGAEGSMQVAAIKLDGTYLWAHKAYQAWGGVTDMATDAGRLFLLHGDTGKVVLVDPANGDEKGSYTLSVPLLKLDLTAADAQPADGFKAVPPAAYSKDAGYGWRATDKVSAAVAGPGGDGAARDGHGGKSLDPSKDAAVFAIDVKPGRYIVRLELGDGNKDVDAEAFFQVRSNHAWHYNFYPTREHEGRRTFEFPVEVRPEDPALELTFSNPESKRPTFDFFVGSVEVSATASRVAARDGRLVAAGENTVLWIDPATGKILDSAPVPDLKDLELLADGSSVAISGSRLVTLARDARAPVERVTGLTDPSRLGVDASTGDIFVGEVGAGQQVKRFDKDWKLTGTFGRKGGRQTGLYHAQDFLAVESIVGDGKGGFIIAEWNSAPRRTAHFGADGNLLNEWYGGQQFFTFSEPDPRDPSRVWLDSQWDWIMEAEVDYAKRSWRPRACYKWAELLDPAFFGTGKMTTAMHVLYADADGDGKDERYLWSDAHAALLLKVDEEAGRLLPVAGLSVVTPPVNWSKADWAPELYLEALALAGRNQADEGDRRNFRGFGWADANGDHRMQAAEMRLFPSEGHGFGGAGNSRYIDEHFNVWVNSGNPHGATGAAAAAVYPALGRTPTGAPVWDWARGIAVAKRNGRVGPAMDYVQWDNLQWVLPDAAGNQYHLITGDREGYRSGGFNNGEGAHAWGWPSNLHEATALVKYDVYGNRLWQVGPKAVTLPHPKGQQHHPQRILGFVNGCVAVGDRVAVPAQFWTEDGLYVGSLFDRRADDGLPPRVYAWWRADRTKGDEAENLAPLQYDMASAGSIARLPDGSVVYYGAGWNNCPAYRLTGWDRFVRQEGTITIGADAKPTAAQANGGGLTGEYFGNLELAGAPAQRRTDPQVWFDPVRREPHLKYTERPWPDATDATAPFSARWSGRLEPKFTEDCTFFVYTGSDNGKAEKVRLWVDGKLLIDTWSSTGPGVKRRAEPVRLEAGHKVAVKLEYAHTAAGNAEVHLCWESLSLPVEHVPAAYLYSQ